MKWYFGKEKAASNIQAIQELAKYHILVLQLDLDVLLNISTGNLTEHQNKARLLADIVES